MLRLALFRLRMLRTVRAQLVVQRETIDRLEIAVRRAQLSRDELAQDLLRLSERLSRVEGRNLRGVTGRPQKAAGGVQVDIEDIAPGDKRALREVLLNRRS